MLGVRNIGVGQDGWGAFREEGPGAQPEGMSIGSPRVLSCCHREAAGLPVPRARASEPGPGCSSKRSAVFCVTGSDPQTSLPAQGPALPPACLLPPGAFPPAHIARDPWAREGRAGA